MQILLLLGHLLLWPLSCTRNTQACTPLPLCPGSPSFRRPQAINPRITSQRRCCIHGSTLEGGSDMHHHVTLEPSAQTHHQVLVSCCVCVVPPAASPPPPRHHGGHWARLAWSTAPSLATVTLGTQLLSSPTGQTDVLFLRLDCKLLSPYFDSFSEAPGTHLVLGECLFIGEHAVSCRSADAGWRGRINQLPPAARTSAFTNLGACEVGKLDLDSSSAAASD